MQAFIIPERNLHGPGKTRQLLRTVRRCFDAPAKQKPALMAVCLVALAVNSVAGTFWDNFSGGLNPAFWVVAQTTSNLYSVAATGGNVTLALTNAPANPGGFQAANVELNLAALGGAVSGDFSAQVDFTNPVIGPNDDQVQLNLGFADSSIFLAVYDFASGPTPGPNIHIYNGSLNGVTAETVTHGTFAISRTGDVLTGYFNGTPIFSESDSAALTSVSFSLQNQPNAVGDTPSVNFENFSITAASLPSDQAPNYTSAVTNTPNLLGYWRFDPVSQTNSVVNGYTGTLVGNAQIGPPGSGCPLITDPVNQALLLDGNSGYMTTTLTGQIANQGTMLVWVYLAAQPSTTGHIFQITSLSQNGNDFDLQINPDDTTHFYTDSGGSTAYTQPLPLNQWHFLAATFIANSSRCIYLDGQLVGNSIAGPHSANNNPFWVGNSSVFGPRLFHGRLDEVAVFNRALTAAEVAAIYAAAEGPALSIASQSHAAVLTWPTNYTGFALQTNGWPAGGNWATLTTSYGVLSNNFAFTNTMGPAMLFYRLMK